MNDLVLADLSHCDRIGVKGDDVERWLSSNDYRAAEPNWGLEQSDGSLLVFLSTSEVVWLGTGDKSVNDLVPIGEDYRCYLVQRQDSHCWIRLSGSLVPSMLAKLCGVDMSLRAFDPLQVAQTSLARVSAVIARSASGAPDFHILVDSSYKSYLLAALGDAGSEFGMRIGEYNG